MLNLAQTLYLFALEDDSLRPLSLQPLRFGLKGAVLADLALLGKVGVDGHRKLRVLDSSPTGDTLLDRELDKIASDGQPKKPASWVHALGQNKLRKQITASLLQVGILAVDGGDLLWAAPAPGQSPPYILSKYCLKQQLRDYVLAGGALASEPLDLRMLALLELLSACNLTNLVFTKDERRAAGKQLDRLLERDAFGEPIARTLHEIHAAVAAAARST